MDKILVVDDDVELLACIQAFLQSHNFEVVTCSKASEALKHFNQPNSDIKLVLSDIKMPEMDGVQLYKEYKNSLLAQKQCAYLLMTGYIDVLGAEAAYEMGVDDLVAKPFDFDTLLLAMNYLLKKDQSYGSAQDKYFPVKIDEFMHSRSNNFNIYVKVNDKFVLVTKSGQEYTQQRLAHFANKGLHLIYLNNEDFIKYTDMQRDS